MTHPVKGIDHCYSLVADLDAAVAQFAALGFTLSPRGMHSEAKGSANHTIMFPDDYFELLGLVRPTALNAPRYDMLKTQGEGLHSIACRVDDASAAEQALDNLGIATQNPGSFERPVDLPGGGQGVAAFSILGFAPQEVPIGTVFMCQHRSRDTVWLPSLQVHANAACGLAGIVAQSDAPERDAKAFARLFANGVVRSIDGGVEVTTGPNSASIKLMSRETLARVYKGLNLNKLPTGAFSAVQLNVHSEDAVTEVLARSKVPAIRTPLGIAVGPEYAAGTIVEFIPA
ncbi:VOC family protein [Roseovarius aestuarii]|nr:VOC family protein [Roseovarius aestuarii]